MGRFVPDGAGFRAARKAGGARYAAFLCALSLRATTFVCFFGAARATATRDPVGALALSCLGLSSASLHFVQNVWRRLAPDVPPPPPPWCHRYASAADSAAIWGLAVAIARRGGAASFLASVVFVFWLDLRAIRVDDIWARRALRATAFAVALAATLLRVPPPRRLAYLAAGAATAALFPCVVASRRNLFVNTALAWAWHGATSLGARHVLALPAR